MKILERLITHVKGTYAAYPELSYRMNLIVLFIWCLGLAVAGVGAFGFALYFILILILGAILMIVCPCIGFGVFAGMAGIWALLIAGAIYIIGFTSVVAALFAFISICCLRPNTSKETWIITIISGFFHGFLITYIYQNTDLIQYIYASLSA